MRRSATGSGEPKFESWRSYIALARCDHVTKHVFVLPGIVLAWNLRGPQNELIPLSLLLGFITAITIASANYVINEWLDRDFDRHHPTKSSRPAVSSDLRPGIILFMWLFLTAAGLISAWLASITMLGIAFAFAMQGLVYNVPPLRAKDRAYLDVISESVNNPIRLMIGWVMIDSTSLPPSSIVASYWLGGAFLMATKRLSEYRQIVASHGRDLLIRYRLSFRGYDEVKLIVSCFLYALLSSFFLAVFLIKYRIEYILTMPAFALLFAQYLSISLKPDSVAQRPEKLFREPRLILSVSLVVVLCIITTFFDIPVLEPLASQHYIIIR